MLPRLALLLLASLTHGALLARPLVGGLARPATHDARPLNRPRHRAAVLMADAPPAEADAETFQFEAEVAKVMDIIINSLYSDKDIVSTAILMPPHLRYPPQSARSSSFHLWCAYWR